MAEPRLETAVEARDHIERRTGMRFTKNAMGNWRSTGKGPRWIKISGKIGYYRTDVDRWIDEQLNKSAKA